MAAKRPAHTPPSPVHARGIGLWLGVAILVVAGLLAYANSLSGPFVLDDEDSIVTNEGIRQLWPPSSVLVAARELPTAGRPLVNLSFALNYALGGTSVRGYHVTNVAIHIVCALLLFGVVRGTLRLPELAGGLGASPDNLAFAAALLWVVHPLQTDAVNYVTQRTELLMALFYLLTFYAAIRGREHKGWLVAAVAACVLGICSKESMATVPLLIVLYDRTFLFRTSKEAWRVRGNFYLALAATWMVLVALMWSGPRSRSAGFSTSITPWEYLLNQTVMIAHYLRLVVWPRGLVLMYGVPRQLALSDVLPYAALVVACAALTMWALAVKPRLGFLGAWFFVTLAPASSILPIVTEVGAERRMYLPLAALSVLAVLGAAALRRRLLPAGSPGARKWVPAIGFGTLALVSIVLVTLTAARNREYTTPISLARTTLERWPTPRAEHWLGAELIAAGQRDEGVAVLRRVLPRDETAHYTLGTALFESGQIEEAIGHLREFLARESLRIEVPTAHETLGRALAAQGKFAAATDEFRQVLQMTPGNRGAAARLADVLFKQEKYSEAIAFYQRSLLSGPPDAGALMNLGISFVLLGKNDDAIGAFRRAVTAAPNNSGAHRNLARALLATSAFEEAERSARQAVALAPDDAVAHDEVGVALAGQGKLDEAVAEFQRSLQIDPTDEEVRGHLRAVLQSKDGIMRHQ